MKRVALTVAAYLVGFIGFWMFCWAGDLIATLHWTTPLDWEEVNRRVVFVMSNGIGVVAATNAWFSSPPTRPRGCAVSGEVAAECATANAHGVYVDHDEIRLVDGKGRVPLAEVRVARTAAGWRATTGFSFTTGNWWGSYSPITDRDPAFPDRAGAVASAAAKLADRLSSAPRHAIEPSMEVQRQKIVAWLVGLSSRQPEQFEMFA